MLEKIFTSSTIPYLSKAMDAAMLRDTVIANNIANVDTPRFKRREVIFEQKLKKVLDNQSNHGKLNIYNSRQNELNAISSWQDLEPSLVEVNDESYRNDGNNVDIDIEMAKRTKNELYYDVMAQSVNHEIRLLRLAITGKG